MENPFQRHVEPSQVAVKLLASQTTQSAENLFKEIEEQIVRRMQDKLFALEQAKQSADKRCEQAQQQSLMLLQQN